MHTDTKDLRNRFGTNACRNVAQNAHQPSSQYLDHAMPLHDTPRVRAREPCDTLRQQAFVVSRIPRCHRAHQPYLIDLPRLDIDELLNSNSRRVDVQVAAQGHPSQASEDQRSFKKTSANVDTLRILEAAYLQGNPEFPQALPQDPMNDTAGIPGRERRS